MSAIELVADGSQLATFEFGHAQAAPALGPSDERGIHQLEHGTLVQGMRDDFGAPPFLAEQSLEQIGGSDRAPVRERKTQMGYARFEILLQAGIADGRAP